MTKSDPGKLLDSLMEKLGPGDPNETVIIGGKEPAKPKIVKGSNSLTWDDDEDGLPANQQQNMSRLVYLIVTHRIKIPWQIARVLPFSNQLKQLHEGLGAVSDMDELAPLYELGSTYGEGSIREAVLIILRLAEPLMSAYTTTIAERLMIYEQLIAMNVDPTGDVDFADVDMNTSEYEKIDYWASCFTPFDEILMTHKGFGFYNGLFVIMGNPGTGKTSLLLTIMEQLVKQGIPVTYYENEIPLRMMRAKVSPLIKRTPAMIEIGRISCGPWTSMKVLADVQANPDPSRVIIWDSPDVVIGGEGGDNRRFDLEAAYVDMIRVKPLAKAVFVSSQPRRSEDSNLSMKSVAESWQKAWYADVIVAVNMLNDAGILMAQVVKNRFGPNLRHLTFEYNHQQMSWTPMMDNEDDWKVPNRGDQW